MAKSIKPEKGAPGANTRRFVAVHEATSDVIAKEHHRLKSRIQDFFNKGLDETVDWFKRQMADYYYQCTDEAERIRHLEILHAMRRMSDTRLTMVDDSEAGKVLFFGRPGPGMLSEALEILGDRDFHRLELHTTADRSLSMSAFVYKEAEAPTSVDMATHKLAIVEATCNDERCLAKHIVDHYLDSVDQAYLARSHPERVARHINAWAELRDPEAIHIEIDDHEENDQAVTRVLIAGSFRRREFITNLAELLQQRNLFLARGYLDVVPAMAGGGQALITTLYLTDGKGKPLGKRVADRLAIGLKALRRYFTGRLRQVYSALNYHEREFEILAASIDFSAQILAADHPFLDVREAGREALTTQPELCSDIAALVDFRFGPKPKSKAWWDKQAGNLRERIADLGNAAIVTVLETMLGFIEAIQLTNVFREDRLGQSFKLDPLVLPTHQFPHLPYGIFFFHGNHGMGFQVRFRASARGGLRLLLPRTDVQLSRSRDKLLREVYDLAWAQQLKNKDIPEGGSKCIALVRPQADATSMVKLLTDSLLDLILPAGRLPEVQGPHGEAREDELIFLGPDENMTPERIVWVANRAAFRGLPNHLTLMSSKPGAGINHKEYGVTSEGVYCWVPYVLDAIGVDPQDKFTVKITGGPDGDVGGNLINILYREQRKRCRILAISDGTGSAYDPDGLNWKELLRLFKQAKGIAHFKPGKLKGEGAHVTPVVDKRSEELRNNMHNEIEADLFIPCGGRPYTINERNWEDFLKADGSPSAKGMIEGANIFITADARDELQKRGMISVKDSSANKGGVICSSYEILAGLVTSEREFTDIKDRYVDETVEILRAYARQEADALLSAWRRRRGTVLLSDLSMKISQEVNRISGLLEPIIAEMIEAGEHGDTWRAEIAEHCPPVLVKHYGDRFAERIPRAHVVALLAKHFASRMLYREGLTWCKNYLVVESAPETFRAYLQASAQVNAVGATLASSGLKDKETIIPAITDGARRELIRRQMGI